MITNLFTVVHSFECYNQDFCLRMGRKFTRTPEHFGNLMKENKIVKILEFLLKIS